MRPSIRKSLQILLLTVICFCFSTGFIQSGTAETKSNFATWLDTGQLEKTGKGFMLGMYFIETQYYQELTLKQIQDIKTLYEKTMKDIAKLLDKHSVYFNSNELQKWYDEEKKDYIGIGVLLKIPFREEKTKEIERTIKEQIPNFKGLEEEPDFGPSAIKWISKTNKRLEKLYNEVTMGIIDENGLIIFDTIPDGPVNKAEKKGLIKKGWAIVKIDDNSIIGKTLEEAINLIRGPEGTEIKLTLKDETGKTHIVKIVRATIPQEPITSKPIDIKKGIYYIKIPVFRENTGLEFANELKKLSAAGATKIIIDLRDNPGGFLSEVNKVLDEFIPAGQIKICAKYRNESMEFFISKLTQSKFKGKIVLLVNKNSASASELMTISLKEHNLAAIIGEKTYGKGTIQTDFRLPDDSALHLTIAQFLSPVNKIWIHNDGIKPDIEIIDNPDTPEDEVLNKAIEYLNK